MIFYGIKIKILGSSPIAGSCPGCKGQPLVCVVRQRYFHIYWIPFFPIGKDTLVHCGNCKSLRQGKELSAMEQSLTAPVTGRFGTPATMFIGLGLVALVVIGSLVRQQLPGLGGPAKARSAPQGETDG